MKHFNVLFLSIAAFAFVCSTKGDVFVLTGEGGNKITRESHTYQANSSFKNRQVGIAVLDTIDLSPYITKQDKFNIRTDYNLWSIFDLHSNNVVIYDDNGLQVFKIDLPNRSEFIRLLDYMDLEILTHEMEVNGIRVDKFMGEIEIDDIYFRGERNGYLLASLYVPEIIKSDNSDTIIRYNPYIFHVHFDSSAKGKISHLPGSIIKDNQEYQVGSYFPVIYSDTEIIVNISLVNFDSSQLPYLGRFVNTNNTLQLAEVLAFNLPDYFLKNKLYYNYNDYILDRNYLIFKWCPNLILVNEGIKDVFKVYNSRVTLPGIDPNKIRFFLYGFRHGNSYHQALVFDQYKIMYHRFDKNKIYTEVEVPIDLHKFHTSMAFIGNDKFVAFDMSRNELIVFRIYEI